MSDKTPSSPDSLELRGAPLTSARLSKKAALVVVVVLEIILGVVIVNVSQVAPKSARSEDEAPEKVLQPALNAAQTITRDVPELSARPKQTPTPPPVAEQPPSLSRAAASPAIERRRSSEDDARLADTAVARFSSDGASDSERPAARAIEHAADWAERSPGDLQVAGDRARRDARLSSLLDDVPGEERDLNQQERKLAFQQKSRRSVYLDSRLTEPVSPFELKTGTVIPSILITEMNSDLPGEIVAQVSQNVYDTATGNYLLIPQGSKLFGRYDSQVSFGQQRVLVAWQRLIYPDASTLELEGMSGHDEEGKGGFADRVNHHYARLFGFALLTSTLSAAYQLSQDPETQGDFRSIPSNRQVAAAAVGQQMTELGIEIARRNLRVQPTIEVRKGYRLNVMVNRDVVFPGSYQP